ncbi:MAG: hypothetical protein JNM88_18490 [Chitinophagaceae bacterium]|nr:hypothetical protein [Chitinophagaceae bacterium]
MSSDATTPEDKVFQLLTEQKHSIERKLIRNVLFQALAIIVTLNFLFKFSKGINKVLEDKLLIEPVLIQSIIPVMLVFLFIEFGYAIGQFFHISALYTEMTDRVLTKYVGEKGKLPAKKDLGTVMEEYRIALTSFTLFDQLTRKPKTRQGKAQFAIAFVCLFLVLLLNQVATFKMIELIFKDSETARWITKLLALGIISFFHYQYFSSQGLSKYSPRRETRAVIIFSVLVMAYFLVYEFFPRIKLPFGSFS